MANQQVVSNEEFRLSTRTSGIIELVVTSLEIPSGINQEELLKVAEYIYEICNKRGFIIPFDLAFELLQLKSRTRTLQLLRKNYRVGTHYIVQSEKQPSSQTKDFYFLTAKCFQDLCMKKDTKFCEMVRSMYMKILELAKDVNEKL